MEVSGRQDLATDPRVAFLKHRSDIDGLRCIAVVAVLLFHAFPQILPGGFAGVDIFFVISGFLITGLIRRDLENGRFSFGDFYARRIRRIFPALFLMLLLCAAAGWLLMLPDEFQRLSSQILGGAAFVSNLVTWRTEGGYFGDAAITKPLLHLWSLGIEEQFYIVWPILLLLLWWRRAKTDRALGAMLLGSFALNVFLVNRRPAADFYLPVTRGWELLVGAALSRRSAIRNQNATAILGAVAILTSFVLVDETKAFPGWWALLSTFGTACVIASPSAWLNRRVLGARALVFVGLISYPLYLWHWPLLVYFQLLNATDFHWTPGQAALSRIVLLGIAAVLAWLTWRFWEAPLRREGTIRGMPKAHALFAAMVALAVFAAVSAAGIVPTRLSNEAVGKIVAASADWESLPNDNSPGPAAFVTSKYRSHTAGVTLFAGDSHIMQYWPRAQSAIRQEPSLHSAVFAGYAGCPPLPELNRDGAGFRCPDFYRYWMNIARDRDVRTIAIGAYWERYFVGSDLGHNQPDHLLNAAGLDAASADIDRAWEQLEKNIRQLTDSGKHVVLIASNPEGATLNPRIAIRRLSRTISLSPIQALDRKAFENFIEPVERRLSRIAARTNATFVRPLDFLCDRDVCPALDGHGEPLYKDADHLRRSSALQKTVYVDEMLR